MTATRAEREPAPWDAQETRCAKSQGFWVSCYCREPWLQGQEMEGGSNLLLPGREPTRTADEHGSPARVAPRAERLGSRCRHHAGGWRECGHRLRGHRDGRAGHVAQGAPEKGHQGGAPWVGTMRGLTVLVKQGGCHFHLLLRRNDNWKQCGGKANKACVVFGF